MLPKNIHAPTAFVANGAVTAGAGCVFARRVAHAGNFPCKSRLTSMKKSIRMIRANDGLVLFSFGVFVF
jgi:hypothetical protein